ncbi:hypothetical protein MLD38_028497 [Melastoma candidum]|uniref:Uncharacterized protein n=1 Tax=Melastoma candidum TaxID=119954 RepID=A0ACB9N219_9MYRT|nr:hypothetical protein MLD38_028497 [Melastoma candidum]
MGVLPSPLPPPPPFALPLLHSSFPLSIGATTSLQTLGNIIHRRHRRPWPTICLLDRRLGRRFPWSPLASLSYYYCMIILVECRDKLVSDGETDVRTYGDVGFKCFERARSIFTEVPVLLELGLGDGIDLDGKVMKNGGSGGEGDGGAIVRRRESGSGDGGGYRKGLRRGREWEEKGKWSKMRT